MEELVLHSFLARDDLYIIDQQYISIPVLLMKIHSFFEFQRPYQFIDERFTRSVDYFHFGVILVYLMFDSFHKVGLAQTRITVDYQRVEDLVGVDIPCAVLVLIILLGNSFAESISQIVRTALYEILKSKAVFGFIRKISGLFA